MFFFDANVPKAFARSWPDALSVGPDKVADVDDQWLNNPEEWKNDDRPFCKKDERAHATNDLNNA